MDRNEETIYYTDCQADLFDELPLWSAPFGLALLRHIRYRKGITALDIGSGTGFPLTEVAMRLGEGSTVYGLDPWEDASCRAEKKIAAYGILNTRIIRGEAEQIPLPDSSVDLIFSNNGLNNVTDLEQAIGECARVMKPGGQFIQSMNLPGTMLEFYTVLENVLKEFHLEESVDAMHRHIDLKRKPVESYLAWLHRNGFTVDATHQDAFTYTFTDATAMFRHFFIRIAFLPGWKEVVPVPFREQVFRRTEQRLNDQAGITGSLTLSIPFAVIDSTKNPK